MTSPVAQRRRRSGRGVVICALAVAMTSAAFLIPGATAHRAGHARPQQAGVAAQATAAEVRREAQGLLGRRADAVLAGDRAAFLAALPGDHQAWYDRQARLFAALRRLRPANWSYDVRAGTPEPAAEGWRLPVRLRYRLAGVDPVDVLRDRHVVVARNRSGRYVLVDDQPGPGAPLDLWELGEVRVDRGGCGVLVRRATAVPAWHGFPPAAAPACAAMRALARPGRQLAILVPADQHEMAELLHRRTRDLDHIAAVTSGDSRGAAAPSGDRVIVNPAAYSRLTPAGRRVVLAHEAAHVAMRAATPGPTPMWLGEGFADHVAYRQVPVPVGLAAATVLREVRAGRLPARLPRQRDFAGGAREVAAAYEASWLACRLLADTYGERRLVGFYGQVARLGGGDGAVRRAFASLGTTEADFVRLWHARLRELA